MISNCQLKRNKDFKKKGEREGKEVARGEGKGRTKKIGNFNVQLSTIK